MLIWFFPSSLCFDSTLSVFFFHSVHSITCQHWPRMLTLHGTWLQILPRCSRLKRDAEEAASRRASEWPKRPSKIEVHIDVSWNGGTPKTPQVLIILVGIPMVVGYHHFRKPPYSIFPSPSFLGGKLLRHIHLMIVYPCWVMATQIFFIFILIPGEMIQFDDHIFQTMWNHQLDIRVYIYT